MPESSAWIFCSARTRLINRPIPGYLDRGIERGSFYSRLPVEYSLVTLIINWFRGKRLTAEHLPISLIVNRNFASIRVFFVRGENILNISLKALSTGSNLSKIIQDHSLYLNFWHKGKEDNFRYKEDRQREAWNRIIISIRIEKEWNLC